ncbi:MAG TPA: hypothetical protein VLG49_01485, partial [Rhabdochlamydiaceae bacterium]|nr:hypothetical protein [Rhabdochlamydiaceae bacterium]
MTLSLSEITDRLINFRHQIQYYETAAYEISSHPCSEEKISRTKLEYERFHTEIVNFKKDVQCIAEKLVTPFKAAILLHCNCLKKDCKGLGETLERSYLTNEMSYELDSLFKKYLFFATSKDRSNLSHIDILKQKNLSIITLSYPIPTPSQLKMSMDLQNTIQRHQEFSVGEMLREVHLLIEKTEYTSIDKILNKDLLHCQLGRDVRNDIYEQLWITAARHPCIHFFDTWSATNFVDHLPELDRIITSQPLYKKLEIGNSIETEDVKIDVGKMLKEIHRLIDEATCCPKERRQQFYNSIGSIFKDLSSSELGLATKNQIFKQVWEDDNVHFFGEIIARSDESNPDVYLLKLSNIISSNPFYINPDISETVDSIELLEKDEGYASDLEGIEEKQIPLELLVEITIETVEEEANNLPNETKGKVVDDEMD